jgi:hypothetical protein
MNGSMVDAAPHEALRTPGPRKYLMLSFNWPSVDRGCVVFLPVHPFSILHSLPFPASQILAILLYLNQYIFLGFEITFNSVVFRDL